MNGWNRSSVVSGAGTPPHQQGHNPQPTLALKINYLRRSDAPALRSFAKVAIWSQRARPYSGMQ
jgi:hypothetical protein